MGRLNWSLTDPSLDMLGRVGVAAMALAIDAAKTENHDLTPLRCSFTATDLELSWPDSTIDQRALQPFIEWVWQTRNAPRGQSPDEGLGVLYLPGIHRGDASDDLTRRLVEHSGILSTFLQHPKIQPKTKPREIESRIEDRVTHLRYVEPAKQLVYWKDFGKQLFKRGKLRTGLVSFSSYIKPGVTSRFAGEDSWSGSVLEAIPLLCAPTACFYLQLRGADWIVVAVDPMDLEAFLQIRPIVSLDQRAMMAASATDAALRVLVAMRARRAMRQLERRRSTTDECVVMRVGKVAWNRQSVRSLALRMKPSAEIVTAYEKLVRHLGNQIVERSEDRTVFVSVPSPRGVIAQNLINRRYWYSELFEVPVELREQVEKNRRNNESSERAWYRWIRRYRKELRGLMKDYEKQEDSGHQEIDRIFREAFHRALRSLYGKEADQAKRGSRSPLDRIEDRTEKIRRDLTKTQTAHHLRGCIAEFFAEAGRNEILQAHGDLIWRFIDDPQYWRRARDLSLLSLATYARLDTSEESNERDEKEGEK